LKRYPHLDELERFLDRIEKTNLKLILLFGSLPKGRYTQHSDMDVLCVFDRRFQDMTDRFMSSYAFSDGLVRPKNITLEEFKEGLISGNSFLHSIIPDSIILYRNLPKDEINHWIEQGKKNLNIRTISPY